MQRSRGALTPETDPTATRDARAATSLTNATVTRPADALGELEALREAVVQAERLPQNVLDERNASQGRVEQAKLALRDFYASGAADKGRERDRQQRKLQQEGRAPLAQSFSEVHWPGIPSFLLDRFYDRETGTGRVD